MTTTVAKIRTKFWIIRAHDLAKSVKFRVSPGENWKQRRKRNLCKKPPHTIHASILLHSMRLFWRLQSKNQQEQDCKALWSYLQLPEHKSNTSGRGHRLLNKGIHSNTAKILCHQGLTSFDAERQWFTVRHRT